MLNRLTGGAGYNPIGAPTSSHIVGGPSRQEDADLELGDLGSSAYYDEVSLLKSSLASFDSSITTLGMRHVQGLASPSQGLRDEIEELQAKLHDESVTLMKRVEALGTMVGRDEGRRGHWDGLKAALKRSVAKYRDVERAQRERVRNRVARQYRIVKPDASEAEVKEVLDSNQGDQIFMQAVAGSRTEGAQAALSEAQSRREEVLKIEQTLTELAQLFNQVAELVAAQDASIITIEDTTRQVEVDTGYGVEQIGLAKASAAAARHKRKLCAAFFFVILLVIVVVIVVEVKDSSSGHSSSTTSSDTKSSETTAPATSAAPTVKSEATSATVAATTNAVA